MKNFTFKLFLYVFAFSVNQTVFGENANYFFSYGLYINAEFIQADLGYLPTNMGVYKLEGYEFSYSRAPVGKKATGGNIQPKRGKTVYGVVWKLNEGDFSILDREERSPSAYARIRVKAFDVKNPKNFKWVEAYIANPDYISKTYFPRPIYVERLTKGARENGFPEEYINTYLEWSGPWGEN